MDEDTLLLVRRVPTHRRKRDRSDVDIDRWFVVLRPSISQDITLPMPRLA